MKLWLPSHCFCDRWIWPLSYRCRPFISALMLPAARVRCFVYLVNMWALTCQLYFGETRAFISFELFISFSIHFISPVWLRPRRSLQWSTRRIPWRTVVFLVAFPLLVSFGRFLPSIFCCHSRLRWLTLFSTWWLSCSRIFPCSFRLPRSSGG